MNRRKTFIASLGAIILGTSCCWISSLILWIGGGAFVTMLSSYIAGGTVTIIIVGIIAIVGVVMAYRRR